MKKTRIIYKVNYSKLEEIQKQKRIAPGAKLILRILIDRLGRKNYCFPSQQRIARDVGMSERMVRKHLKTLKNRSYISWVKGTYNLKTKNRINSNKYDLSFFLDTKEITVKN